jgi:DNA-binding transcriptional LysR family regulator
MDFTLLKSFIAVADEKSFSTASKHLFLSQQSLSKQIAKLEEELGTPLFVRSRPLELTQDGKQFLQTARAILQLKRQYEESSSKSISGEHYVHLGIEHTVARAILPHVLPDYLRHNPDTYVKLSEESPEVLQKTLSYDGVDLVIGTISDTPDTYISVPLCRKEQLLVVPKIMLTGLAGDAYEEKKAEFSKAADLSYFESLPFIKIPRLSSGGRTLVSYLKYYDINPRFVCELTNVENAFQLANSGLGVFIYPRLFWDMLGPEVQADYLKNIDVFPLPYLPDIENVCAYYHRENGLVGKTRELFDSFVEFFDAYKNGIM